MHVRGSNLHRRMLCTIFTAAFSTMGSLARAAAMIALSSLCLASSAQLRADDQALLFDPTGYRIDEFRAPVPATVQGAKTIDTEGLRRLLMAEPSATVLIDVLPAPPRPPRLASSTLWLPAPHHSLPTTAWLPNVGYGRLSDALDQYFRSNLERLTESDKHRPVVIFCEAECWMSWNAARRAAEYGYTSVYWYPDGTTGWEAEGYPLEPTQPVAVE
jgi:PQQ-dependent catabolism-associated CXXCW motif protein